MTVFTTCDCRSNFRGANKVDELKMILTFDLPKSTERGPASSVLLPDKVQLEIRDGGGRIVFKKRQNVYYVKLQERISALDSKKCELFISQYPRPVSALSLFFFKGLLLGAEVDRGFGRGGGECGHLPQGIRSRSDEVTQSLCLITINIRTNAITD